MPEEQHPRTNPSTRMAKSTGDGSTRRWRPPPPTRYSRKRRRSPAAVPATAREGPSTATSIQGQTSRWLISADTSACPTSAMANARTVRGCTGVTGMEVTTKGGCPTRCSHVRPSDHLFEPPVDAQ